MDMMKRDLIVFEHERFELTGYNVWMTAGEIASLFGVTIMKVRGCIRKMERDLKINLEAIIAVSYYIDTGLGHEFRRWICDRTTRRKERAMIVYF